MKKKHIQELIKAGFPVLDEDTGPDLSTMIAFMGKDFDTLTQTNKNGGQMDYWKATSVSYSEIGNSPEEAVVRLIIETKRKK